MSAVIPFPPRRVRPVSTTSRLDGPKAPSLWRVWARRITVRRELAALHREQLRDAGLDPRAVRAEALKPFWRA